MFILHDLLELKYTETEYYNKGLVIIIYNQKCWVEERLLPYTH